MPVNWHAVVWGMLAVTGLLGLRRTYVGNSKWAAGYLCGFAVMSFFHFMGWLPMYGEMKTLKSLERSVELSAKCVDLLEEQLQEPPD